MLKKTLIILCALALLLTAACGNKPAETTKSAEPELTLIVGLEASSAPFNWMQVDDKNDAVPLDGGIGYAGGYDVKIAKYLTEQLNAKLIVKKVSWEGLQPAVDSGAIDLIIAGMTDNATRRETLDFTAPYYESDFVLVTLKSSKFAGAKSLDDLSGARVAGQLSTNFEKIIPQIPGVDQQTSLNSIPLLLHAIKTGTIDATPLEKPQAIAATSADPDLAMVEFAEGKGFKQDDNINTSVSIGMKKGREDLRKKIDEVLVKLSQEQRDAWMQEALNEQPAE